MCSCFCQMSRFVPLLFVVFLSTMVRAAPPTQDDVNIYSGLCRTGSLGKYELSGEMGIIGRRLIGGQAKLSAEAIKDEFPGINDEKNRLFAIQAFQDCIYRYVERFHPRIESNQPSQSVVTPSLPSERRREIVFLANQLEDFKNQMERMKASLPETYYDKNTSIEKKPKDDPHIFNLENYSRYKAFQTPDGILDFSNVSNSDIAILCDTYQSEVRSYYSFWSNYSRPFVLSQYRIPGEVSRICSAASEVDRRYPTEQGSPYAAARRASVKLWNG